MTHLAAEQLLYLMLATGCLVIAAFSVCVTLTVRDMRRLYLARHESRRALRWRTVGIMFSALVTFVSIVFFLMLAYAAWVVAA